MFLCVSVGVRVRRYCSKRMSSLGDLRRRYDKQLWITSSPYIASYVIQFLQSYRIKFIGCIIILLNINLVESQTSEY